MSAHSCVHASSWAPAPRTRSADNAHGPRLRWSRNGDALGTLRPYEPHWLQPAGAWALNLRAAAASRPPSREAEARRHADSSGMTDSIAKIVNIIQVDRASWSPQHAGAVKCRCVRALGPARLNSDLEDCEAIAKGLDQRQYNCMQRQTNGSMLNYIDQF